MSPRSLSFALFVLLNGFLLLRPAELVASWSQVPFYEVTILACLALSGPAVLQQLTPASLKARVATLCIVLLPVAAALSQLSHFQIGEAVSHTATFLKVILYFLLLVGVLDTPERLRRFLGWLLLFAFSHTTLVLLQHHGIIDNPALAATREGVVDEETGETIGFNERLSGAGLFANPNDLSRLLVVGIALALYRFEIASVLLKPIFFSFAGVFLYALARTQSRGGLISLGVLLVALFHARFGTRKTLLLAGLALPLLLIALGGGRQTDLSTSKGTGQQRIQLWHAGLEAFRSTPVFGIGIGNYPEVSGGYLAHNSFVEAYVELGFVGGTLFLAAVCCPVRMCYLFGRPSLRPASRDLRIVRPYILGIVAGYAAGMLSSSRPYAPPTYLFIGLAIVYTNLARADRVLPAFRVTGKLVRQILLFSLGVLVTIQVYVMATVRFGEKFH